MILSRPQPSTLIAHVDMNAFFVSVERLKDPSLEGLPVVVGGQPEGRSVVSSASYEARRFGIHSAMPMSRAVRLCPELVIVVPGFSDYKHYHDQVREILVRFTPEVEMSSIDEGYLDLTGTGALWGQPVEVGRTIRQTILAETGLPASLGLSSNKLISKVASDEAKPSGDPRLGDDATAPKASEKYLAAEGVVVVPPGEEANFLAPLPISHLPGCGPVTVKRLNAEGIATIGDLAALSRQQLERRFGEHGQSLYRKAQGIGSTVLGGRAKRKSVSKERTFDIDKTDLATLRSTLHRQCEEVAATLREKDEMGRTITLKLRYAGFETHTYARSIDTPTHTTEAIFDVAVDLLTINLAPGRPVRLIGMGVSNLGPGPAQGDLFDTGRRTHNDQVDTTVDAIRKRFGKGAILTGESIHLINRQR